MTNMTERRSVKTDHVYCGRCWGASGCATCWRLTNERKSDGFRPEELLAVSLAIAGLALLMVVVGIWAS